MSHFENIANKLVSQLNELGVECYVYHVATTGSIYIRFNDPRMCSIRIGDHDGKEKLKYKFNLRNDISPSHKKWIKDGNIWRYYLPLNQYKDIIPVLQDRFNQIKDWPETKHQYTTPSFKK